LAVSGTEDDVMPSGTASAETVHVVRLSLALRASPRSAQGLLEALRFLLRTTRLEPGCLSCAVWSEPDSIIRYEEEWATEDDIRRRIRSDRFTSLLSVVESAQEPPRVQFDFVTATRGLDYVAEVRQASLS
jgi:quinol monooxygenase YgiN